MSRLALCVLLLLAVSAGSAGAAEAKPPFTFVVPVSLSNLHKNLSLLRVRCWVLPGTDWKAQSGALGEGVSGPVDTVLDDKIRTFSGDVSVNVSLHDPRLDPGLAKSYRCQIELYDSSGRVWADMAMLDKRYPIDKAALAISQTGGAIAP
jgi:hypothetical protein